MYSTAPSTWSVTAASTPPWANPNGLSSSSRISISAVSIPGPTSTVRIPRYSGIPAMGGLPTIRDANSGS